MANDTQVTPSLMCVSNLTAPKATAIYVAQRTYRRENQVDASRENKTVVIVPTKAIFVWRFFQLRETP